MKDESKVEKFIKKDIQKEMAKDSKRALADIEKILSPVLDITDPSYKVIVNALVNTISILSKSVSAQAKEKYGYYLISRGHGIIQIHYYLHFRHVEAKFLTCKESQTLIGYSYAIAPYL